MGLVRLVGQSQGMNDLKVAVYPGAVTLDSQEAMRAKLEQSVVDEIVKGLTGG